MKTIVIAAGYATRLYPLTENQPKPLLEIGGKTILGRMLDDIDKIDGIDEHVYTKKVTVIDDETLTNETRLGAVADLLFAIERLGIDDDLLVVAADNLLFFSFQGFVDYAREKGTSCIMCHEQQDVEKLRRTGVIVVDEQMKVLEMQEKPEHPKTTWAVPPFYVYLKKDLPLIKDALNNGCGKDAPGNLAHYLAEKTVLHAWKMPGGRFDIGSLDTYYEAVERFRR